MLIRGVRSGSGADPHLASRSHQQAPVRFEYVRSLARGSAWGEGNLVRPQIALVGPDSLVYVIEQRGGTRAGRRVTGYALSIFSMDGRLVRRIGADGDWPREFPQMILNGFDRGAVLFCDGDRLVEWREGYRVPRTHGFWGLSDWIAEQRRLRDTFEFTGMSRRPYGGRVLRSGLVVMLEFPHWNQEMGLARAVVYRSRRDTAATVQTALVQISVQIPVVDRMAPCQVPFGPRPQVVCVPDRGILTSSGMEPILRWYDFDGNLTDTLALPIPPYQPTEADLTRFTAYRERRLAANEQMPERVKERVRMLWVPSDSSAYCAQVAVDDCGYYWLRLPERIDQSEPLDRGYRYHVLNSDGRYLGIVEAPFTRPVTDMQDAALPIPIANGYFAAAVADSARGGPDIRLFRIVYGPP